MSKQVAVILAGAVAKGAYQAGVLKVLADQGVRVTRIVAASSGALNAAVFASHIRAGTERAGADELCELWAHHAAFGNVFALDLASLLRGEGLSSMEKVRDLLRARVGHGRLAGAPRPISLRILVAPLEGVDSARIDALAASEERGRDPAPLPPPPNRTTFEHVCDFNERDFETPAARERVIDAALASSAFPFAFAPVELADLGPCIDGGTVNNTPIKWAVGGAIGDALDAIVVVTPTVERDAAAPRGLRGTSLVNQVVTLLINERLYRDLREADQVNEQLARLRALVPGHLTPAQHEAVLRALGWSTMRRIDVIQIRPSVALEGHAFAGFRNAALRDDYVRIGRECAEASLATHRWLVSEDPVPAAAASH